VRERVRERDVDGGANMRAKRPSHRDNRVKKTLLYAAAGNGSWPRAVVGRAAMTGRSGREEEGLLCVCVARINVNNDKLAMKQGSETP
jgi:hypothetical protein